MQYYSQHGEDYLTWELFGFKKQGYFVEVGALDGIRFSNTYSFEQQGWDGLCIEAHPKYIELLKKNRPKSKHFFAAAGDYNGSVSFYTNSRGSLSTLDASQEELFEEKFQGYFTGFEEIEVPIHTLNHILKEVNAPTEIDFISIDVEGSEMRVLDGLDLRKYRPRLLILEAMTTEKAQQLGNYLIPIGYKPARALKGNIFYCHDIQDIKQLKNVEGEFELTIHPHPDDNQKIIYKSIVITAERHSTSKNMIHHNLRRIINLIKKLTKRTQ